MSKVESEYSPPSFSDSGRLRKPLVRLLNVPCPHCDWTMSIRFIESDDQHELTTLGCGHCGFERIVTRPRR